MALRIKGGGDPIEREGASVAKPKKKAPKANSPSRSEEPPATAASDPGENLNTAEKVAMTSLLLRLPTVLVERLTAERFRRKATTRTALIQALLEEGLEL